MKNKFNRILMMVLALIWIGVVNASAEVVVLPTLGISIGDYITAGLTYITAGLGVIVAANFAWKGLRILWRMAGKALHG